VPAAREHQHVVIQILIEPLDMLVVRTGIVGIADEEEGRLPISAVLIHVRSPDDNDREESVTQCTCLTPSRPPQNGPVDHRLSCRRKARTADPEESVPRLLKDSGEIGVEGVRAADIGA
jgi:hypothetical protein